MSDAANPRGAAAWREAVLTRIEPQTARVKSFFLRTTLPRHAAGQHVDVRLTASDGYQAQRSYSIASAPGAADIELVIERLDDGEVSPFFHEVAQPGDTVELRGPIGGHFVWRAQDGGPLLLVGGGSGVVPLVAMLRERAAAAPATPALLIYSARSFDDVIFRDELVRAHEARGAFRLMLATTRGPAGRVGDHEGRLERASLAAILAQWGHVPRRAYVCGGNEFVAAMADALVSDGLPASLVRTERYGG
jgi:ferredoxin-NADP reductase